MSARLLTFLLPPRLDLPVFEADAGAIAIARRSFTPTRLLGRGRLERVFTMQALGTELTTLGHMLAAGLSFWECLEVAAIIRHPYQVVLSCYRNLRAHNSCHCHRLNLFFPPSCNIFFLNL